MMRKHVLLYGVIIMLLSINYSFSQNVGDTSVDFEEIIWHVKAFKPNARILKVKAIDEKGNIYDVKVIQNSNQTSLLDVKAFVKGKRISVKMLPKEGKYYPVKAIDDEGHILGIKAITEDGKFLPVKGVSQSGNIVHIRAIYEDIIYYNVIAISPDGMTNGVKGIKMSSDEVETIINGVKVFAHIKSMPQKNY